MHFGKKLLNKRHEPWADYYLDYNQLKHVLEGDDSQHALLDPLSGVPEFLTLLDEQVEQVVHFFLQQQGLISRRLMVELAPRLHELLLVAAPDSANSTGSGQRDAYYKLYKDYQACAYDILYLVQFVDLNVTALRKILKKHDKITGTKLSPVYLSPPPQDTYYGRMARHDGDDGVVRSKPILRPLLEEHGGLETLFITLQNALEDLSEVQFSLEEPPPLSWQRSSASLSDRGPTRQPRRKTSRRRFGATKASTIQ
jgi:hypothetical protein